MIWNEAKECMSRDEMHHLQGKRLVKTVNHVYHNVEFYRKKMQAVGLEPGDIQSTDDIVKLPYTTKDDLRDTYPFGLLAVPQSEIVRLHASSGTTGKPIVTVVINGRPMILTWCAENTDAILMAYYPGSEGGIAIAETLYGMNNPTGKLPVQLPRDMESVLNQSGDVAFDLENPLFDFGCGLSYE